MSDKEYPDSVFNMRAIFYERTKKNTKAKPAQKTAGKSKRIRKLRDNVRLHQMPTKAGPS